MRTVKDDGVAGLFRGAGPTIARAMALNMGMFASNEQAKELLAESTPMTGLPLTASASMIAGFFAAACSLPFDFVKTRLQKMTPDAAGKYPYSGFVDCAMKVRALAAAPLLPCAALALQLTRALVPRAALSSATGTARTCMVRACVGS